MTEPPIDGTTSPRRALLGCCAVVAAIAVVGLALLFWLWSTLAGPGTGDTRGESPRSRTEAPRSRTESPRSRTEGGVLTRSEREELQRELRDLERELEYARGQARLTLDPGTRAGWQERADELAARRDEIETRLGR